MDSIELIELRAELDELRKRVQQLEQRDNFAAAHREPMAAPVPFFIPPETRRAEVQRTRIVCELSD